MSDLVMTAFETSALVNAKSCKTWSVEVDSRGNLGLVLQSRVSPGCAHALHVTYLLGFVDYKPTRKKDCRETPDVTTIEATHSRRATRQQVASNLLAETVFE